eukprot:6397573-Amphidinium_carterae.1
MEAAATALILRLLLMPLLHHKSSLVPQPVRELGLEVSMVVVICTNGLFESAETHRVLLQVPNGTSPAFLPLLSEQGFRFPPKDFASQLERLMGSDDASTIGSTRRAGSPLPRCR